MYACGHILPIVINGRNGHYHSTPYRVDSLVFVGEEDVWILSVVRPECPLPVNKG